MKHLLLALLILCAACSRQTEPVWRNVDQPLNKNLPGTIGVWYDTGSFFHRFETLDGDPDTVFYHVIQHDDYIVLLSGFGSSTSYSENILTQRGEFFYEESDRCFYKFNRHHELELYNYNTDYKGQRTEGATKNKVLDLLFGDTKKMDKTLNISIPF